MVSGVRIDPVSQRELLSAIDEFLANDESHVVHFLATHPVVLARQDPAYREILNRGDLNLPDGIGVIWGLRMEGCRASRLVGPDTMRVISDWGVRRGIRHYLYGGGAEVVERLDRNLRDDHPGIRVVGMHSPPFKPLTGAELRDDAERIRRQGVDLLWVGLGTPKQDRIAEELRQLAAAPVILCVGAAFDFISGAKPRAPAGLRRLGLEWLYRLATEPRRLWRRYLVDNARFVAGVAHDRVAEKVESLSRGRSR